MKPIFVLLIAFFTNAFCYYENSEHITLLNPLELSQLHDDESNELWLVQFFNGADNDGAMVDVAIEYERAAKSMDGYVKCAAIDVASARLLKLVMKINKLPSYVFYGYYKYAPDKVSSSLETVEDIHEASLRQIGNLFDERRQLRYINSSLNTELGSDVKAKLNKTANSLAVVYYSSQCKKCEFLGDVWIKIVKALHEKIRFASSNTQKPDDSDNTYPAIKFYPKGPKKEENGVTYNGDWKYDAIYQFLYDQITPPTVTQLNSGKIAKSCLNRRFCMYAVLPKLTFCDETCRTKMLNSLQAAANKHRARNWMWLWNEFDEVPVVQNLFSIDSPLEGRLIGVLVMVNMHASMYKAIDLPIDFDEALIDDAVAKLPSATDFRSFDSFIFESNEIDIVNVTQHSHRYKTEL